MKKRYGIILDEDRYREMRSEAARAGRSLGDWLEGVVQGVYRPIDRGEVDGPYRMIRPEALVAVLETPMDDTVKKAIEPDKTKVTPRGRLTKGLGPLPGEKTEQDTWIQTPEFRPVPKPGKK